MKELDQRERDSSSGRDFESLHFSPKEGKPASCEKACF